MAVSGMDAFIDSLTEDWLKNVFVDRLDNARLLVDDEQFGDKDGAATVLSSFMKLDAEGRTKEMERLRVRNQVVDWAKNEATLLSDVTAMIVTLRNIRDARKVEPEPEPEPEENSEAEE